MTKEEKMAVVKTLDDERLLDMLVKYAEYADAIIHHGEENHESYEVVHDEIIMRMSKAE